MTVTITRLFDDYETASRAVRDLESAGLNSSDISIVANNSTGWYTGKKPRVTRKTHDGTAEGAEVGAGIGAVAGGAAGLLAGLGMLAIPGIGPVVAAGWLASTAAGAAAVGLAGGIIGALTDSGVSEEEAEVYAEGVKRGGAIVTARVADSEMSRYEAILDRASVDIAERENTYRRAGWKGYDETLPPG
jgi:hypothetical protein